MSHVHKELFHDGSEFMF